MGLLDEAIREHLELQRKRGGDPTDLARQEQEALGPAVREAGAAAPAATPVVADPAPAAAPAPEALEPAVPDPEAPPAHHPQPDDSLQPDPEAPAAPAEPESPPPPEFEPAGSSTQETAVFDVDDVFAEEDAATEEEEKPPADEDVLEETPEFLQETPEHDRLWFEQKPPKDFDFDD